MGTWACSEYAVSATTVSSGISPAGPRSEMRVNASWGLAVNQSEMRLGA